MKQQADLNPYSTPTADYSGQRPTRQQRILLFYQSLHETPPTFTRLFARMIPRQILLLVIFIVCLVPGGVLLYVRQAPMWPMVGFGIFLAGTFLGKVATDLGLVRRTLQSWPVLVDIIDWQRVEQQLSDNAIDDKSNRAPKVDSLRAP